MTVKRVPVVCCVCGSTVGVFVIDDDEDGGLSLPKLWCESCKLASLLERGLAANPLGESSQFDHKIEDAGFENGNEGDLNE